MFNNQNQLNNCEIGFVFTILVVVLLISCNKHLKTEKHTTVNRKVEIKDRNHLFQYPNGDAYPNDSLVYQNVMRWKNAEDCAKLFSYAKSTVELLRLNEYYTNYRLHTYHSCEAILYRDTLEITFNFSPFGGGEVTYFENKPLKFLIHNSQFDLSLTHTSDVIVGRRNADGTVERVPFPQSKITHARLTLGRESYAVGDTIKGDLYARAIFKQEKRFNRREQIKNEIIKGSFRVIVEDRKDRCFSRRKQ